MIDIVTIENRIREYQLELAVLRQNHEQMVAAHQQQQQKFNETVGANQNRFQQLTGAITELQQLRDTLQVKGDNNEPSQKKHRKQHEPQQPANRLS